MHKTLHSITLEPRDCIGCTNCVKFCPTGAIRVRGGKAVITDELCIDCGRCIKICTYRAKKAVVDPISVIKEFPYTVALPSPAFYMQFHGAHTPEDIDLALSAIGFTGVYNVAYAAEDRRFYTEKLFEKNDLTLPVVNSDCPVVAKLIQIRFPELIPHILPVLPLEELAAAAAKKYFSALWDVPEAMIKAIFISPCAAKSTTARAPLGFAKSSVDYAVAVRDVYPPAAAALKKSPVPALGPVQNGLEFSCCGAESRDFKGRALAADGLDNIIEILGGIEDRKFEFLDFVELWACSAGCVGGVLTTENAYVAKARSDTLSYVPLQSKLPGPLECGVSFDLDRPIKAAHSLRLSGDMRSAIEMLAEINRIALLLPGMDCGACGAPTCRAMAEDIVRGRTTEDMCVFRIKDRYFSLGE